LNYFKNPNYYDYCNFPYLYYQSATILNYFFIVNDLSKFTDFIRVNYEFNRNDEDFGFNYLYFITKFKCLGFAFNYLINSFIYFDL
jgi:hypothetical protein